jgi:hypothetical protein
MGQKIKISESELRRLIREAIENAVAINPDAIERLKSTWIGRVTEIGQQVQYTDNNLQQILSLSSASNMLSDYGIGQDKMNLLKQADSMLKNAINLINEFVS